MLELTGMGTVLRGLGSLYWILAITALSLAVFKSKGWQRKALWSAVVVAVFGFLPIKGIIERAKHDAYGREAWAYFKKKCETEAGDKIYKTFKRVKSVLVLKPLPPATEQDLYDQFWYGDPYSNATPWNKRDITAADSLLRQLSLFDRNSLGFDFVELRRERGNGYIFERLMPEQSSPSRTERRSIDVPVSKFGVEWEDISTPTDRAYWVAGSRLRVIDLSNREVVAERIGFLIESGFGSRAGQRRPWLASRGPHTTCPTLRNGSFEDRLFILSALSPIE